jgi:hypothetical protein
MAVECFDVVVEGEELRVRYLSGSTGDQGPIGASKLVGSFNQNPNLQHVPRVHIRKHPSRSFETLILNIQEEHQYSVQCKNGALFLW